MRSVLIFFSYLLFNILPYTSSAQEEAIPDFPAGYFDKVSSKAGWIEKKLDKRTGNALRRLQKEEGKLRSKLTRKDSLVAEQLFSDTERKYNDLLGKVKQLSSSSGQPEIRTYIPYLDTLKTALHFLDGHGEIFPGQSNELRTKVKEAIDRVNSLDGKINQLQGVQQYLKERRQYLKEQLSKFGLEKHLKKLNKELFYYSQAIADYKAILKDPKKIEQKALAIIRGLPAFKKFMQQNSQLSSLFGAQNVTPGTISFAGLQSRATVQQLIQSSVPIAGSNPQQFVSQQLQTANSQVSQQKKSINISSLAGNYGEMPDFKPNTQKTKSFFKRLEYGLNVQFGKINRLLPVTSELAFSLGYKLNDNGVIGVGSSYRLGMGTGINHIRLSHQGYGLRSYADWRIIHGFFLSGGYERNNLPELERLVITNSPGRWQESGLIGLSKKYPLNKKRGYVQLLFDFLSYKNIPRSQPVLFRTGINF